MFALVSAYAIFVIDPAIFVSGSGYGFLPAAVAAPLLQDEGDGGGGSDDGNDQEGGEEEPSILDIDGDGELTEADLDALYLAIDSPEKFEEVFGYSPDELLDLVDSDDDKEFSEEEIFWFGINGGGGGAEAASAPACLTAGAAKRWQASIAVSPFAYVNMQNGNLLTAIPLVAWDPVGPPVGFAVYHNSLATTCSNGSTQTGFSLGNGWSCSYSARVEGSSGGDVTVIHDDGTRDDYTYISATYTPPAGVFDRLTYASNVWTLTTPNQTKLRFDATNSGRLMDITDSAGNVSTIHRDGTGRIDYVKSAADGLTGVSNNRLTFAYASVGGKLDTITDALSRVWSFNYDASNRLWKINYPTDSYVSATYIQIGYTLGDRVASTRARDAKSWSYAYNATTSKLSTVTDPGPGGSPYTQTFAFASSSMGGLWANTHTDRRSKVWTYRFDSANDLRQLSTPMSSPNTRYFTYDSSHNRLTVTNELSKTWTMTYGSVGNVATIQSPLTGGAAQTWTMTWVQYGSTNLWRLTQVTDPLSDNVQYAYADSNDPTLVTSVTEMIPESGGSTTVTSLEYYGTSDPNARGQLKKVTDGNGVEHRHEYDQWGYFSALSEGLAPGGNNHPVEIDQSSDDCGRVTAGYTSAGGGPRNLDVNNNDHPLGVSPICYIIAPSSLARLTDLVPSQSNGWEHPPYANLYSTTYDSAGRPKEIKSDMLGATLVGMNDTQFKTDYDSVNRPNYREGTTGDDAGSPTWSLTRRFDYSSYDGNSNLLSRSGPDGQTTTYTYDNVNRVKTITRGSGGTAMDAEYFYDAGGRLEKTEYANGTYETRTYDDADRLLTITHKDAANTTRFRLTYTWNNDNTVATREEYDNTGATANTDLTGFEYDHRKRLRSETRMRNVSTTVYDLEYTYDGLGNRLQKIDYSGSPTRTTYYYYDTVSTNRETNYQTNNNRLLKTEEYAATTLKRTVRYTYYNTGHCSNITIKDTYASGDPGSSGDYDWYYSLALQYNRYDQLWRIVREKWKVNGSGQTADFTRIDAKEFFYESGRARYLTRDVNPNSSWQPAATWNWTDYDGDQPYGDFTKTWSSSSSPVETTRFLDGFGAQAVQTVSGGATKYLHADLTRSTNATSDGSSGSYSTTTFAYTAFGEKVGSGDPTGVSRSGYCGGWGYESGLLAVPGAGAGYSGANSNLAPITLQHVGARWYQPGVGRFLQRDPIGIAGGLNVYVYCRNNPVALVDPLGLWDWANALIGALAGAGTGILTGNLPGAIGGAIAGGICGGLEDDPAMAAAQGAIAGVGGGLTSGAVKLAKHLGAKAGGQWVTGAIGSGITAGVGTAISGGSPAQVGGSFICAGGIHLGIMSRLGLGVGALTPDVLDNIGELLNSGTAGSGAIGAAAGGWICDGF